MYEILDKTFRSSFNAKITIKTINIALKKNANLLAILTKNPKNNLRGCNGNEMALPANGILLIALITPFTALYGIFTKVNIAPEAFCNKKATAANATFQTSPIVSNGLGSLITGGVRTFLSFFKFITTFLIYLTHSAITGLKHWTPNANYLTRSAVTGLKHQLINSHYVIP